MKKKRKQTGSVSSVGGKNTSFWEGGLRAEIYY